MSVQKAKSPTSLDTGALSSTWRNEGLSFVSFVTVSQNGPQGGAHLVGRESLEPFFLASSLLEVSRRPHRAVCKNEAHQHGHDEENDVASFVISEKSRTVTYGNGRKNYGRRHKRQYNVDDAQPRKYETRSDVLFNALNRFGHCNSKRRIVKDNLYYIIILTKINKIETGRGLALRVLPLAARPSASVSHGAFGKAICIRTRNDRWFTKTTAEQLSAIRSDQPLFQQVSVLIEIHEKVQHDDSDVDVRRALFVTSIRKHQTQCIVRSVTALDTFQQFHRLIRIGVDLSEPLFEGVESESIPLISRYFSHVLPFCRMSVSRGGIEIFLTHKNTSVNNGNFILRNTSMNYLSKAKSPTSFDVETLSSTRRDEGLPFVSFEVIDHHGHVLLCSASAATLQWPFATPDALDAAPCGHEAADRNEGDEYRHGPEREVPRCGSGDAGDEEVPDEEHDSEECDDDVRTREYDFDRGVHLGVAGRIRHCFSKRLIVKVRVNHSRTTSLYQLKGYDYGYQ